MTILQSRPALRWLAPAAFLLVLGGTGLVAASADANGKLPNRSVEQLLVDVQNPKVDALSGTIVQKADLGLPQIPGVTSGSSSDLQSLLSGDHTMRVWYSGPDKARLALQGRLGESDVIANGSNLWTWSSQGPKATHRVLTGSAAEQQRKGSEAMPTTPQAAAKQLLAAVTPTTTVTPDSDVTVAGHKAYELVLRPKDARSTITQVRIAIDGSTHLPLRVQVFGTGHSLVVEVAYTQFSTDRPDAGEFGFNPPPGTKVTEVKPDANAKHLTTGTKGTKQPDHKAVPVTKASKTVGKGWTTVWVTKAPAGSVQQAGGQLGAVLNRLPKVSGAWGSGRLLEGKAFSAVVTDDGRIAVGAVHPELLYAALR